MSEFFGASADDLRALATLAKRQSERIEDEVIRGLDLQILMSSWTGHDAEDFQSQWRSSLVPMLRGVVAALSAMHDTLQSEALEQVLASLDSGSGSSGTSVDPEFLRALRGLQGITTPQLPDRLVDLLSRGSSVEGTLIDLLKVVGAGGLNPLTSLQQVMAKVEVAPAGGFGVIPGGLQILAGLGGMANDGSDPFAQSTFAQGLLGTGSSIISGSAGKVLGGAGGMLGAFTDGAKAYESFSSGSIAGGLYDSAHGLTAGAGVFFPPVGWCLGAWDAGVAIGTTIGETEVFQSNLDQATQIGLEKVGGDATKLVERYEGVPGFFNTQVDAIEAWFR
ncbi:MAG: hypothetical protein WAS02_02480 [Propionicimonas sp.]